MRQRSAWKQFAGAVGHEAMAGRKARDYPQTSAALDLWARRNALGSWRYCSPEMAAAELGVRTNRSHDGIDEIEERINAAIQRLPIELREVVRLHHLHTFVVNGHAIRVSHEVTVAERARRFLNTTKDRYYDMLAAAYFHIAGDMGYDGR